jgi:hypothetical protein
MRGKIRMRPLLPVFFGNPRQQGRGEQHQI